MQFLLISSITGTTQTRELISDQGLETPGLRIPGLGTLGLRTPGLRTPGLGSLGTTDFTRSSAGRWLLKA